ncbi:MAG: glycosyltransferase [Porticoccaceae bacterium]|nr:glycosyltransferase [Porticoccaceae bacterium]
MNNRQSVVFLYSEVGPYNIPVFREIVRKFGISVHVVRWDDNCLTPYNPQNEDWITYYRRSQFDKRSLDELINTIDPSLIYVSGWMDKLYLDCSLTFKRSGTPTVAGFDDMWVGSWRQIFGQVYFRVFLKKYFDYAWVAGDAQYEFVRRMGFSRANIIFDLLSADLDTFSHARYDPCSCSLLYVGNFRHVKGIDTLIVAFKYYREELKGKLSLTCVGGGELRDELEAIDGIHVVEYQAQSELIRYVEKSVGFVLPSEHDQWGVVVHEFSGAGMPLILSSGVGASSKFLIHGYNGFSFPRGDAMALANAFMLIENEDSTARSLMSSRSRMLAQRVSPETSAANLISLINRGQSK